MALESAIVGTIVVLGGGRLNKLLIKNCFILYDCSFIVAPTSHMSAQYLSLPPILLDSAASVLCPSCLLRQFELT